MYTQDFIIFHIHMSIASLHIIDDNQTTETLSHLSHSCLINAGEDLRSILLIAMTGRGETSATGPSPRRSFGQRTSLGNGKWEPSHDRTAIERS